ncbi:MAG: N-acetylmuramoyl-L-alanine amidase [Rhodospirillaceae bacterium]|nr:N-acetylmuramoyl-L-alanine amidase [Rhodospirillaceae bacterium]
MRIRNCPSPNHEPRPAGAEIDILVLHYTGMRSCAEALARLRDPAAKVSAHYLIDEDGAAYRLVAEEARAWHAGVSHWAGDDDVNSRSVGIELVNPGHEFGYRPFPEAQIATLENLAQAILTRCPISPSRVVGHSDVAPARKQDPGELFPWERLARSGIGLWPKPSRPLSGTPVFELGDSDPEVAGFQHALAEYGYGVEATGTHDDRSAGVATAFQRHFRPTLIDGRIDPECLSILGALLARPPLTD